MRPKLLPILSEIDFNNLIKQEVIDGVKNKKGFDYNTFINKDLNGIICKCKSVYRKLNIWGYYGYEYHMESDILRLSDLTDHRTPVCINLGKVPLYFNVNPNELKAPLIKFPAMFNFLNKSIEYTDALINSSKQFDDKLEFGLNDYFNGFNTYYVNPMFFKYGKSIPICHLPITRWENGTDNIVKFINKAFIEKYNLPLFFLHGDTTFEELRW